MSELTIRAARLVCVARLDRGHGDVDAARPAGSRPPEAARDSMAPGPEWRDRRQPATRGAAHAVAARRSRLSYRSRRKRWGACSGGLPPPVFTGSRRSWSTRSPSWSGLSLASSLVFFVRRAAHRLAVWHWRRGGRLHDPRLHRGPANPPAQEADSERVCPMHSTC